MSSDPYQRSWEAEGAADAEEANMLEQGTNPQPEVDNAVSDNLSQINGNLEELVRLTDVLVDYTLAMVMAQKKEWDAVEDLLK